MSGHRDTGKARLYADMQRLLATLMQRDIADPRLIGLSITRLEAVHGCQQVRVFVHRPQETQQAQVKQQNDSDTAACVVQLNRLAPHLAHELRHAMPRRRLPGLKFIWDESIDGAAGVTGLLSTLEMPS
ncbi:MAG: ribosome-binding factor A [Mariprofundaceae bacterium]